MNIRVPIISLLFCAILCLMFSFSSDLVQKKVIRNNDFDIHFYVSLKDKKTSKDRNYYWYKSGEIHQSFGDAGGKLLHEGYVKYYNGNQLAEKGEFKYGLKKGLWKEWNSNGTLKVESEWINGAKSGSHSVYNEEGELVKRGKYKNDIMDGLWVNHPAKDSTWYKDGVAFKEHPKIIKKRQDSIKGKKPFWKRLFKKKNAKKTVKKGAMKSSTKKKQKDSFFKRLFSKKKDKTSKN